MILIITMWTISTYMDTTAREVAFSVLVVATTAFFYAAWRLLQAFWLRPLRIKRAFEAQGIKCLPFRSPRGNLPELSALAEDALASPMNMSPDHKLSHDIAPRILPYLYHWPKLSYGDFLAYWVGPRAQVTLTHPDQAKEILSTKFGYYTKATGSRPDARDLVGGGLVALEGEKWAQHRRIMTPAFFLEKLKAMAPTMAACTTAMMEQWESQVDKGEDIEAFHAFQKLTADIIAHTAFGSNFAEGRQVFEMQHEQQLVLVNKIFQTVYIPGSRYIPTAYNRYRWKMNRNIASAVRQLVEKRLEASKSTGRGDSIISNDLLGLLIAANDGQLQGSQKNLRMGMDEIINECKTFFFVGHETTSTLLTWTFLLLASNPEWQERAREEVHAICGMQEQPSAESSNHLNIMNMVLHAALRLYPPVTRVVRKASRDVQLGKVTIPPGTLLDVPIIAWHHDKRFWGPDASEFRPERFEGGVGRASRVAHAFLPFGMGPRNCIGQTFALLEAKVVLSTILQRYRFRLSPNYCHAPITNLSLQPQLGMPMIFEKLNL